MSIFTKWHLTYYYDYDDDDDDDDDDDYYYYLQFFWNLTFIFSDSPEKFSLMLLQMTNYIFSPWKM